MYCQYPILQEGDNPKAMAVLLLRIAVVSYRYRASESFNAVEKSNAVRKLLNYPEGVALRGNGDYSYYHRFDFVICARCNTIHRNTLLHSSYCVGSCGTCTRYDSTVRVYDGSVSSLNMHNLIDVPVEVAYHINQLLLCKYNLQEYGEFKVDISDDT